MTILLSGDGNLTASRSDVLKTSEVPDTSGAVSTPASAASAAARAEEAPGAARPTSIRYGRFSGLLEIGERVFWGINPRSDQNQTPLGLTKFDPADIASRTRTCSNPGSLEIAPAFLQDGDDPAAWAMYAQAQRRFPAHTTIATTWPAIVHLAELVEEYIV